MQGSPVSWKPDGTSERCVSAGRRADMAYQSERCVSTAVLSVIRAEQQGQHVFADDTCLVGFFRLTVSAPWDAGQECEKSQTPGSFSINALP